MNEKYIVINVKGIGDNNSKLKFYDNGSVIYFV